MKQIEVLVSEKQALIDFIMNQDFRLRLRVIDKQPVILQKLKDDLNQQIYGV